MYWRRSVIIIGLLALAPFAQASSYIVERFIEGPLGRLLLQESRPGRELVDEILVAAGRPRSSGPLTDAELRTLNEAFQGAKNLKQLESRLTEIQRAAQLEGTGTGASVERALDAAARRLLAVRSVRAPRTATGAYQIAFVNEQAGALSLTRVREAFLARDVLDASKAVERLRAGGSLAGERLTGIDLATYQLPENAVLSRARLSYANLSRLEAKGVNLAGADLRGASLKQSSLRGADLSGADLRGADLRDADLTGANLAGADLRGADLRGAHVEHSTLRRSGWSEAEARALGLELNWMTVETSRTFRLLERPIPVHERAALRMRWESIDRNMARAGRSWQDAPREAVEAMDRQRLVPSGTLQGETESAVGRANWDRAEARVLKWIKAGEPLTPERVQELNRILGSKLSHNGRTPGRYRNHEIFGGGLEYVKRIDVAESMDRFFDWYASMSAKIARGEAHPIEVAAGAYQRLITIHPFSDGNGRTSRAVMDWILRLHGYPPATFESQNEALIAIFARRSDFENYLPGHAEKQVTRAVERSLELLSSRP